MLNQIIAQVISRSEIAGFYQYKYCIDFSYFYMYRIDFIKVQS